MTEIVIITREGKMIAKPFQVNDVASAIAEQEQNTNSSQAEVDANQDTEASEDVQADN